MSDEVRFAEARALINGKDYAVVNYRFTNGVNGIPAALVELPVGRRESATLFDTFKAIKRGVKAELTVNGITVLSGVVDDIGPSNVQYGAYGIQVILLGTCAVLSSGSLGYSKVIPKTYRDLNAPFVLGISPSKAPVQLISQQVATREGFGSAVRATLTSIARGGDTEAGSITAFIEKNFGGSGNRQAADALARLRGDLRFREVGSTVISGMIGQLNELMTTNWFNESFFDRLIIMGDMLRFRVVEAGTTVQLAPFLPVFPTADAHVIGPDEYAAANWNLQSYVSYAGCVLTAGNTETGRASDKDGVVGMFKDPRANNFGKVLVQPAPSFITEIGTSAIETPDPSKPNKQVVNKIRDVGDKFAQLLTGEANFESRAITLTLPYVSTDYGPLTPVEIRLPSLPGLSTVAGSSIFGIIQKVTLAADAGKEYATTAYEIGYARSELQQQSYRSVAHPLWADRWRGVDLRGRRL